MSLDSLNCLVAAGWRRLLPLLLLAVLALAGCKGRAPAPLEQVTQSPPTPSGPLPAHSASVVIRPDEGGVIALQEGAQVSFPRGSLSGTTLAGLQVIDAPPAAPLPRSIIGDAYELKLEDGRLTGLALVKLPLPAGVSPEEYELSAYRWNGRVWERVTGRVTPEGIQFSTDVPALYAVQGRWRHGAARLGLTSAVTDTLRATVPISVTGQYRYMAPPKLQDGYTPARLTLKHDSSGGAGQVTGNEALDETIAEASLLFQPDPDASQGTVDFAYQFEVAPGSLDIPPGATARFYAVLQVDDSEAPTRQSSPATEYVQTFPIKIVGSEVIRPEMADGGRLPLRWNVQFNGATLAQPASLDIALPLDALLAQGGVGEYRITLEAQIGDQWTPASNTVSVTLASPGTPAGPEEPGLAGGGTPIAALPQIATPTPTDTPPAVPTRRSPPVMPSATPTIELTPTLTFLTPTPTPSRPDWASVFWADQYTVPPNGCTTLHWNIQNVEEVYLNGVGVTGTQSQRVCPDATITYGLRAVAEGKSQNWYVTIKVEPISQVAFDFTADPYEITSGSCTTLRWNATNVRAVYLNGEGVPGESSRRECPTTSTIYELRVEDLNGAISTQTLNVTVVPADRVLVSFWADQYTLNPDVCTMLHWSVERVQAVYLDTPSGERGVTGVSEERICPGGDETYTLRAVASDGRTGSKTISFDVGQPALQAGEVISQAIVRSVTRSNDVDSASAGEQPGWSVVVDGVNPLYRGPGDCCQAALTLQVPQSLTTGSYPVDWPISAGQWVEFRSICSNGVCMLPQGTSYYLRLRSS